jgi:hypothetical protein
MDCRLDLVQHSHGGFWDVAATSELMYALFHVAYRSDKLKLCLEPSWVRVILNNSDLS